jgi:hypothetical protein
MQPEHRNRPSSFASTLEVRVAERVAGILMTGFDCCDEDGVPLTERQKVALVTAALLGFDGVQVELQGMRGVERLLAELRSPDGRFPLE